jgi:hypothetical protein
MNKTKKIAKAFQKDLESADNDAIVEIINDVCDIMQTSQFRKPITKYKVEIILRNKHPMVNNTTREAYRKLCDFARDCSVGNSVMLGLISNFEKFNKLKEKL